MRQSHAPFSQELTRMRYTRDDPILYLYGLTLWIGCRQLHFFDSGC